MGGVNIFGAIAASVRRRRLQKKLELAKSWPMATGEVLSWRTVTAHPDAASLAAPDQIEARYYFTANGEYSGGLFRSVAMGKAEIREIAAGTPKVYVRYDPANIDSAVVMAEDNRDNLPFRVLSGY